MGALRLIAAPIRGIANSRLFQLVLVVVIIVLLDHYSFEHAALRPLVDGLKGAVTTSVEVVSEHFRVGILTDPVLQVGLMILYVYLFLLLIFFAFGLLIRLAIDLVGSTNFLWLRSTIARERGIAAYKAWLPLERIRPKQIPQADWETRFAWPADDRPPYSPWPQRAALAIASYAILLSVAAVLIHLLTPLPIVTWLYELY